MNFFILQSILLIALAYFLGALIGCWLRKMFKQSASMLHTKGEEVPVGAAVATAGVATAGAVAATRFAGAEGEASIEINRSVDLAEETPPNAPVSPPVDIAVERETVTFVEPEPVIVQKAVAQEINLAPITASERVLEPIAEQKEATQTPVVPPPVVSAAVTDSAAATDEAVIKADEIKIPEIDTSVVAAPATKPIIDDLTKIKGVGLPIALELKKNGVTRFQQVAQWTDEDVKDISQRLGFAGRIERENWMAQAKILAAGEELEFTTHQFSQEQTASGSTTISDGSSSSSSKSKEAAIIAAGTLAAAGALTTAGGQSAAAGSPSTPTIPDGDDLKKVIGIGTNIEQKLNALGITRFTQIAAWTPNEVAAISRRLEIEGRIDRENWIEQAKNLAAQLS